MSDAPEDVIAIIRAGARGYVTKTISGAELADGDRGGSPTATRSSRRGWPASCSTRSRAPPPAGRGRPRARPADRRASARCCSHIARGYLYKEVAARLGISAKTVEAHVSSVLRKLQLSTRHELSRWAMERKLVD